MVLVLLALDVWLVLAVLVFISNFPCGWERRGSIPRRSWRTDSVWRCPLSLAFPRRFGIALPSQRLGTSGGRHCTPSLLLRQNTKKTAQVWELTTTPRVSLWKNNYFFYGKTIIIYDVELEISEDRQLKKFEPRKKTENYRIFVLYWNWNMYHFLHVFSSIGIRKF